MFDVGLMKMWFVAIWFISVTTLLLSVRTWFRLRALEKSEQAKTLDLYEQIDKLKNRIDAMFN
jgi:hypothetical protein